MTNPNNERRGPEFEANQKMLESRLKALPGFMVAVEETIRSEHGQRSSGDGRVLIWMRIRCLMPR